MPTECFSGIAKDDVYRRLIHQAAQSGINMLRVWGGGIYERVGSRCLSSSHGGFFVDVVLRGLVEHLDGTRPYHGTSPYSLTDAGSDTASGDCHFSSLEEALVSGMEPYRKMVAKTAAANPGKRRRGLRN